MKKILLLLMIFMLSAATGIVSAEEIFVSEGPGIDYIPNSLYNPDKEEGIQLFSDTVWNISSSKKKELYNKIVNALNNKATQLDISQYRIPIDVVRQNGENVPTLNREFSDMYYTAVFNNPQNGYLVTSFSYGYKISNYSSVGYVTILYPKYLSDYNIAYDAEAYEFAADYALSMSVAPDMNEIEKLLSIHDYLTDNIIYSTQNGQKAYTPYGALVEGIAVCQGYSLAYKYLCDRAGLDVSYVVDTPHNHIWNVAEIDGKFYHIDVTWDDPVYNNDPDRSLNSTLHNYFLLSDETNYEIRDYTGEITWVNYFGSCTDKAYENLVYKKLRVPLVWKNGAFWGRDVEYVNDGTTDRFEYNGLLAKVEDGVLSKVDEEDYAPFDELECRFGYAADGVLAVYGPPGTTRTLFSASYKEDGSFDGVKLGRVSFNSKGKSVLKDVVGDRQLLWNDGMKPAAYPR